MEINKNQVYELIQHDIKQFYVNRFLPLFKRYVDMLGATEPIPRELLSADFGLYEIAFPEEIDELEKGIDNLVQATKSVKAKIISYDPENSQTLN